MNTRDTSDKNKENEDIQTIEHTTESSQAFDTGIDPIHLLQTLDGCIETLSKDPSENDIQRIESELASMEVITMEQEDKQWWMNEALVLHKYVMRRPMSQRISHLFKTKGEWKSEHIKKDSLEVKSRVHLPMELTIQPEAEAGIKSGEINPLLLSVMGLRSTIEGMLMNGSSSCGVFPKPQGVIHMNKLKMWLEDNENYGLWGLKDELSTISLYDIVDNTTLTTGS